MRKCYLWTVSVPMSHTQIRDREFKGVSLILTLHKRLIESHRHLHAHKWWWSTRESELPLLIHAFVCGQSSSCIVPRTPPLTHAVVCGQSSSYIVPLTHTPLIRRRMWFQIVWCWSEVCSSHIHTHTHTHTHTHIYKIQECMSSMGVRKLFSFWL